jgi:hypothetical protein
MVDGVSDNGYAYQSTGRSFTWAFANQLKWDKTFNDVHYISALAQMSYQKQKYDFLSSSGENVAADGLIYVSSFGTNEAASGLLATGKNLVI